MVIPSIAADPLIERLAHRIAQREGALHATGLWGSSARLVTALSLGDTARTVLYVTAHLEQADAARDDLELFCQHPCSLFPAWETIAGEGAAAGEIDAERLALCTRLCRQEPADRQDVIVTPIQAIMQPAPTSGALEENTLHLAAGASSDNQSPEDIVAWVVARGFTRLSLVESPGDVAQRGDIVDLFVPGETQPFRVQFLDDTVESIRRFDVSTQRSIETLESICFCIMPPRDTYAGGQIGSLLDFLPGDTLIVLASPAEIHEMGQTLMTRLGVSQGLSRVEDVLGRIDRYPQLQLTHFGATDIGSEEVIDFGVTSLARFDVPPAEAVSMLCQLATEQQLHVVCDNEGEMRRLADMIREEKPAVLKRIDLTQGTLHAGFEWTRTGTIVVSHHELFHRHRQRRRVRKMYAGRPIESWTDLSVGDLVVHVVHGIAVYRGLTRMSKSEDAPPEEFLTLEFADSAVIHVPVSQVDLVQKYIGASGRRPQLSKLGGKRWKKTKEQVAEAVSELAESLLRVQATRAAREGIAYPADTEWQREFEAAFMYEETEDQLRVAEEISADLGKPQPMDRLVCGDVGYGKTELAMRAAFKVMEFGRQVAMLVPTTVLAEQHYRTLLERMADFPFSVGCLSRFRSGSEQRRILNQAKKGQVDIVVGTHRLLSKDVSFANLGLVIIDEEQRFGVEHKEALKTMRQTVDVLTLTATPIPRTMHMSLVGIRDISALQTPPVDRRSISTQIRPFERGLIRNAILRELNRDGQVFFIHNFVRSIASVADTIKTIVPEARVVFAHGQMKDGELEEAMQRFVRREADVLVATTIIESGIDLPSVNTIFIDRANRFGLADLHQLRGRVGRSHHRAYCYLLLPKGRPPTGDAAKRLKTIEEFSELGAGFRIAMRDLEIRGAGNLLGREQSGHIGAVGYDLYCRLLDQSVRQLKGEPDPAPPPVNLDLDAPGHIPQHYITADASRIEAYRRIVACRTMEELDALERDLVDAFGPIPDPTDRLLQLAQIRVRARRFGISSISLRPPDVIFRVSKLATAEEVFVDAPGSVRTPDANTIHLRLPPAYLEQGTLVPVLRRMLTRAYNRAETLT